MIANLDVSLSQQIHAAWDCLKATLTTIDTFLQFAKKLNFFEVPID